MKKFLRFLLSLIIAIIVGAVGGVMMYNKFNSEEIAVKQVADSMLALKADTVRQATATDSTTTVVFPVMREEIPAEIEGSAVFFTAEVNGIPMKFMLDTGCNSMTISYIEYLFLKNQGKISRKSTKYGEITLADGSKRGALILTIDSVKIGSEKIENVSCSVLEWQDTIAPSFSIRDTGNIPLLIGGDIFIKMEKRLSIDYKNKKIILENT
jgi:predicted aspartyl protease